MLAHLKLTVIHAEYQAEQRCRLPAYKGSTLRGVLGHALRDLSCLALQRDCADCRQPDRCPAGALFDATRAPHVVSFDQPAPYVVTPPLDEREIYSPGDRLAFGLTLIGKGRAWSSWVVAALARLGGYGLGPFRSTWRLSSLATEGPPGTRTELHPGAELWGQALPVMTGDELNAASLAACGRVPRQAALRFLSPTDFQVRKRRIDHLDGPTLISRLLRRIGSLAETHAGVDLRGYSFAPLLDAAATLRISQQKLVVRGLERYSNRQQQRHPLHGFVGSVLLEDIPPILWPYIAVGQWVHVGKGSTFGMGKYLADPIAGTGTGALSPEQPELEGGAP
jgi:hypothetical protein